MKHENESDSWSFEKELVFESGAAIGISIGYNNVKTGDVIGVITGLEHLVKEISEKVSYLKKMGK
ncbi:hypothetical protein ABEW24_23805 [Paenibacillus jamilae]|uniref:hypothetical protein n=1 Tax=Paenibacillus TaxID=44249 RepID=UPI00077C5EC8|nr:hypothetical protein [Paenibacillus polymyxa]KYG95677.1 hypothetical protein AZE31_18025 [Paenibacillus polymyxa]